MIKIKMPNDNYPERKYIVDTLFGEFLELDFEVVSEEGIGDWIIELENTNQLIVRDCFFSKHAKAMSYYSKDNIPGSVIFFKTDMAPDGDIPILFGASTIDKEENKIVLGFDVFATCFYMLTRWEEGVLSSRDEHNRFPAEDSLAHKFGFLDRPIVNEYVELIWDALVDLNVEQDRKEYKFSVVPTHDVDNAYYWKSWKFIVRTLIGDLVRRRSLTEFFSNLVQIKNILLNGNNDPFDTFDELMDVSEFFGVQSSFFFMCGGDTKFDNSYDLESVRIKKLIKHIESRGHLIGIHPSYNTFNDGYMLKAELKKLDSISFESILSGRQHVLRYDVTQTPTLWDGCGLAWDSTLGYAKQNGFRSGVCWPYSMYDLLGRKKLRIKQRPLIFMEVSDFKYKDLSINQSRESVKCLVDTVKKYDGEFVFLWHNSNMTGDFWKEAYDTIYRSLFNAGY